MFRGGEGGLLKKKWAPIGTLGMHGAWIVGSLFGVAMEFL